MQKRKNDARESVNSCHSTESNKSKKKVAKKRKKTEATPYGKPPGGGRGEIIRSNPF